MRASILLLISVFVWGCTTDHPLWKIDCDSGFSTGVSEIALIDDGSVKWKDLSAGLWHTRSMIGGEICTVIRVSK